MVKTHPVAWRSVALAAVLGAAVLAVLAFRTPAGAADASVSISGLAFNPANVTVNVGDSVTWTNNDAGIQHTVSSDSGSELGSGAISSGATYVHEFNSAGTYTYHCDIHPTMTGTVVVQQVAESPTASPTNTNTATATSATGTATQTPTQTATSTPTAGPPTLTPTNTSVPPTATATSTTVTSPASPTPGAPNTGDGGSSAGSNAGAIAAALGLMAVIGASGAALALRGSLTR